ncbi:MAG: indole-3-glycerol phosphate synthase TrpC [Thermodesulfobacteriota bacterium]|nr:indole-3-glycerol phosphate synthase TrpC [Thermodesulfobacteriota bacterium]
MFLRKIVEKKKEEVEVRKKIFSIREREEGISNLSLPRDLMEAISQHAPMALIAEIKFASPSAGVIKTDGDPRQIASEYESAGASAISVLTEPNFFKGDLSYLGLVKEKTSLPVLQKDFIIDPFQIFEGRAAGADAVLLIAAILDREQLNDFVDLATSLRMVPLVEIHDEDDLEKISTLSLPLIGINNRNLKTFEVDLRTTLRLKKEISSRSKVISESGIKSSHEVRVLREAGVDGILVGEILMRSSDPTSKIKELLKG